MRANSSLLLTLLAVLPACGSPGTFEADGFDDLELESAYLVDVTLRHDDAATIEHLREIVFSNVKDLDDHLVDVYRVMSFWRGWVPNLEPEAQCQLFHDIFTHAATDLEDVAQEGNSIFFVDLADDVLDEDGYLAEGTYTTEGSFVFGITFHANSLEVVSSTWAQAQCVIEYTDPTPSPSGSPDPTPSPAPTVSPEPSPSPSGSPSATATATPNAPYFDIPALDDARAWWVEEDSEAATLTVERGGDKAEVVLTDRILARFGTELESEPAETITLTRVELKLKDVVVIDAPLAPTE